MKFRSIALFAALIGLTVSVALAGDTDLGQVTQFTNSNGQDKADMLTRDGSHAHLWQDEHGKFYLKWFDSDGTVSVPKGATVKVKDGTSYTAQVTLPGDDQIFVADVTAMVQDQIASLVAQSPALGETFYPLELPAGLETLGNGASLFGNSGAIVTGVVGFYQKPDILSLLGSSTSNGLSPVRFDYNPNATGLTVGFSPGTITFVTGNVFTPTPTTTFESFGRVAPEPATTVLIAGGLLLVVTGRWLMPRGKKATAAEGGA